MFNEKPFKEPVIPSAAGHEQAGQKLSEEKIKALEDEADRVAEAEKEEAALAEEARKKELDELYSDDKDVMTDIFPSWQNK